MLPIISIEIDGKIVASFDIGGYTTISGKTLYIYLRSIYKPIARNPEIMELCGNQVNLKVLGIEIPARELVEYWNSLEDYRGFKLSEATQAFFSKEAIIYAKYHRLPSLPLWIDIIELIGLMYYFEKELDKNYDFEGEIVEIKKKLNEAVNSKWYSNYDFKKRLEKGIPSVINVIRSYRSELRFAKLLADSDIEFLFVREKGDIKLYNNSLRIDVTKAEDLSNLPSLKVGYPFPKEKASLRRFVSDVRKGLRNKVEDKTVKAQIVAIDVSNVPQLEFNMYALQKFGEVEYDYHFWIEEAIKEAKEGRKPIILFSHNYGINIEDCAVTLSSDLFLA
ncbi:MAG: hypothetical protein J7J28_02235 [Thaumarchaeota archaeon]|nr:hypothetical protein [Nitrososphaerota archaeon]